MNNLEPAAELSRIASYLRAELGYESDLPGNVPRHIEENYRMIREIETTLRGSGNDIGVVGWITIFRRTWITLVALLGAAAGYMLNDVVEAVNPERRATTSIQAPR